MAAQAKLLLCNRPRGRGEHSQLCEPMSEKRDTQTERRLKYPHRNMLGRLSHTHTHTFIHSYIHTFIRIHFHTSFDGQLRDEASGLRPQPVPGCGLGTMADLPKLTYQSSYHSLDRNHRLVFVLNQGLEPGLGRPCQAGGPEGTDRRFDWSLGFRFV